MAIGFEHLRGPNGEQWMGMSPPQQRSNQPTMTRRGEQNPMLSSQGGYTQPAAVDMQAYSKPQPFQNAAAAQKHQDAFVQQFLQSQAQYNQGLQSGQQPQRVDVDQVWNQAGKNIQSGAYQGNPFQTGNAQAIAGLFNQYGMAMPTGFQEQLLAALAPQSAPPMYQPSWTPKFTDPGTGLPYGQVPPQSATIYLDPREMSPGGFVQPGPSQLPPMNYPGGPTAPPQMGSRQPPPQAKYDATAPNTWGRDGGPPGWSEAYGDMERAMEALGPTPILSNNASARRMYADAMSRMGILTDTYRDEGVPASSPVWFGDGGGGVGGGGGRAQPTPPRTQGTPYGTKRKKEDEPLDAAPGSSGPGWRESGGKRIYDGYTDPRGTGAVGAVGPNHVRPGMMRDPVTGQLVFDPFTDPIGTGGAPAYGRYVPAGNTWGPGAGRREPAYRPSQPGAQRRRSGGDVFGVG